MGKNQPISGFFTTNSWIMHDFAGSCTMVSAVTRTNHPLVFASVFFAGCFLLKQPPPAEPLPAPGDITLELVSIDKTQVRDNDVVSLTIKASAACDFVVSAVPIGDQKQLAVLT